MDYRLKLIYMKLESLVIVYQYDTVNQYLSSVHTARHIKEVSFNQNIIFYLFIIIKVFFIIYFYKIILLG